MSELAINEDRGRRVVEILRQRTPMMTWIVMVCVAMNPVAQAQDYRIPELGGETDWRRQIRNNPPLTERQWLERVPPPQPYCPPCRVIYVTTPVYYQMPSISYGLYQNAFNGRLEFGWYLPR